MDDAWPGVWIEREGTRPDGAPKEDGGGGGGGGEDDEDEDDEDDDTQWAQRPRMPREHSPRNPRSAPPQKENPQPWTGLQRKSLVHPLALPPEQKLPPSM
ncbi:hypothetical protein E4U42_006051 [Claviceps africana]|uniref:Uncharacterized protein n=1 Tax=Claviceps africana TaxID=83212 RepID=A0A8K0NF69_9HYPO|nr:hypothetical protein E4U42_006051 [Claviceps africana]